MNLKTKLQNEWQIGLVFPNEDKLYAKQLDSVEDYDCTDPFDVYAVDKDGKLIGYAIACSGDGCVDENIINWACIIDAAQDWDDFLDKYYGSVFYRLASEFEDAEPVDDVDQFYEDFFEPVI